MKPTRVAKRTGRFYFLRGFPFIENRNVPAFRAARKIETSPFSRSIARFALAFCLLFGLPVSCLLSPVSIVEAAIPSLINYQGRLTDAEGKVISGSYTMIFRLYDASTSGTELWKEQQTVSLTEPDNGIFNVVLGSVTSLSTVDFNSPVWLSVQVSDDNEMTPRQRMTAVGYAMNADTLDALDSSKFMRTDVNTSTSGKLTITATATATSPALVISKETTPSFSTSTPTQAVLSQASSGTDNFIDAQVGGTSKFKVDASGNVTVAGNLAVSGTTSGSTSTTGTTNTTWTIDNDNTSATEPASGAGLVIEGGSADASMLWDATNDEIDINKTTNITGTLNLSGSTSGYVGLAPAAAAGSTTYTLPSADGTSGQVLSTNGSGVLSWASDANSGGDITGVTAGTGLTGGGSSGSVTLALDTPVSVANGGTGATSLNNLITLGTHTTGNFLATASGSGAISVSGSGSESAAITISCPTCLTSGGGSDLFTLAGSSGSNQTISSGDTLTIAAGTGITTTAAATDTLTVAATLGTSISAGEVDADALNFSEFADSMSLDNALTLAQGTNAWAQTYTGTTGTGLSYTASSLTTGKALSVSATNTATSDTAINPVTFSLTNAQATTANTAGITGLAINYTNNPSVAGNTEYAAAIQNQVTTNTTDNALSALLLLDNADTSATGSTVVTDALKVTVSGSLSSGIVDALDVSDANIDNAINIGANTILGTTGTIDLTNFDVDSSGNTTLAAQADLRLSDADSSNYVALQAPATVSSNVTWTLPSADATVSGQVLSSNASGVLSWATVDTSSSNEAPVDASYLTLGANGTLTAERVLTEGTNGIDFVDGGANSTLTVNLDPTEVGSVTWGSGSGTTWTFDAGATDPTLAFGSALTTLTSDMLINTTGADELSSITTSDATTSLAISTNPDATGDADGVIKLGKQDGAWEYIHYDASLGSGGKFVFSAPLQVQGSSPATITFDDGTGATQTLTYDSTASKTLNWSDTFSAQQVEIRGASPAVMTFGQGANQNSLIYDPETDEIKFSRGVLAHDFRNLMKNASFEAFSAFETFHDTASSGYATGGSTGNYFQGGWNQFAPDDWTWVSGQVFQNAPSIFDQSYSAGSTTYTQQIAEGKSAVTILDSNMSATLGNFAVSPFIADSVLNNTTSNTQDGRILQIAVDLSPKTVYTVAADMLVENATNKAILDIEGEDQPSSTLNTAITNPSTTVSDNPLSAAATTINVASTTNFASRGSLVIEEGSASEEMVSYTGITSTSFTGVTRAQDGTSAVQHASGTAVVQKLDEVIINAADTSGTAATGVLFPPSGALLISTGAGQECFTYKSSTFKTISAGVTRGAFKGIHRATYGTTRQAHAVNAQVTGVFIPLVSQNTSFTRYKGSFVTGSTTTSIKIHLIGQASTTPAGVRFDSVQLVKGAVVPSYAPNAIVDTGDQTLYGTLRVGRTTDSDAGGGGGLLVVDRYVRSRGIEFFTTDPGFTGTTGGMGGITTPVAGSTNSSLTISLDAAAKFMGQYQTDITVTVLSGGSTFKVDVVQHMQNGTNSSWNYANNQTISTYTGSNYYDVMGARFKFSANSGTAGDTWTFTGTGLNMGGAYDSFKQSGSYIPSQKRIFVDTATNKLTFEDGSSRVTLDQLVQTTGTSSGSLGTIQPQYTSPYSIEHNFTYSGGSSTSYEVTVDGVSSFSTSLTAAVTASDTTMPVTNGSTSSAVAYSGNYEIIIENEKITCSGTTAASFTGCSRGKYGTLAAAHTATSTVLQPDRFKWRDNLPDTSWDATGVPITGKFQTLSNGVQIQFKGSANGKFSGEGTVSYPWWSFSATASSAVTTIKGVSGVSPISVASQSGDIREVSLSGAGCSSGQILKWNGSSWACQNDAGTTYFAGNGLSLTGSTFAVKLNSNPGLAIDSTNGLSLLRSCADGQILKWNNASSSWVCSADSGAAGSTFVTQEGGTNVDAATGTLNLTAADFTATSSPAGTVTLGIDYANSNIVRSNVANTFTAAQSVQGNVSLRENDKMVLDSVDTGGTANDSYVRFNGTDKDIEIYVNGNLVARAKP